MTDWLSSPEDAPAPGRPPPSTPAPQKPCQNRLFRAGTRLAKADRVAEISIQEEEHEGFRHSDPAAAPGRLAVPGRAGAAPAGANVEVGESIDVRVVNVEAVVTDSRGQRIKGLKPTDFRLLVDGKEVPIDYFTEIRGGAAVEVHGDVPASPVSGTVGRNLLIFIDQSFTIQAQLDLVLRRLEEDLDRLAPGDQVALVAADPEGHLKILTDWTSDAARLRAVLAAGPPGADGRSASPLALESLENDRVLGNMAVTGEHLGRQPRL